MGRRNWQKGRRFRPMGRRKSPPGPWKWQKGPWFRKMGPVARAGTKVPPKKGLRRKAIPERLPGALKARPSTAQGNALGHRIKTISSPERARQPGRICSALTGLCGYRECIPRALPWAVEGRPVGAEEPGRSHGQSAPCQIRLYGTQSPMHPADQRAGTKMNPEPSRIFSQYTTGCSCITS